MSNLAAFYSVAPAETIANFKAGLVPVVRGKKLAQALEKVGFIVRKESAQYYAIDWAQLQALRSEFFSHGKAVRVIRIDGKYCDSMGAYESLTVADADGREFSVGNKYDTAVCFRDMDEAALLTYANK